MRDLDSILVAARAQRESGAWAKAIALYSAANEIDSASYEIKHNLALCHFGNGGHHEALRFSREALALKPDLWQSRMIQAKILRAAQRTEDAERALKVVLKYAPLNGHALLALADIEMNEYGDSLSAAARVAPLHRVEEHRADAELTTLMSKLYDRDESDEELSEALKSFAARELTLPGFRFSDVALEGVANRTGRIRLGLMSPLFCVSPVYYLTIGALRLLSREVDLVVFNRGTRVDWATRGFQTIAREWHNVQNLPAPALANFIKRQSVDVLFDLGGWMDPVALRALTVRPAKKMYKWVGGQSATTGLTVFDGFISDVQQTPAGTESLYSEPLINIPSGYVSYTPNLSPDSSASEDSWRQRDKGKSYKLGVIGNPAKISRHFLTRLEARLDQSTRATDILFVDRRYCHPATIHRVLSSLPARHHERLVFRAPADQAEYLREISCVERILDTFPYNGGLTSLEAMHLGKTIEVTSGKLFAARHTMSHDHFWRTRGGRSGPRLRLDHNRLAKALGSLAAGTP